MDRREIIAESPSMKFIAMIHPPTLERQVQALQVQIDAPDMIEACNLGRAILCKMQAEQSRFLLADIWWAPELQGDQGLN